MPELPEVETVRRGLSDLLVLQPKLEKIELRRPDLRFKIPLKKLKNLEGEKILQVGRRAKYLWFETTRGYLISHLGMTGTWRVFDGEMGPHDHVILHFAKKLSLVYRDPRRFGFVDFSHDLKSGFFAKMGPEPFASEFNAEYLRSKFKGKSAPIKNTLMDQRVVVGVGNIYASEILFEAQIRPQRASGRVTLAELHRVVKKTQQVLGRAIEAGGSTLQDFAHTNGNSGNFQNEFRVYARGEEDCLICKHKIRSKVMAGRSTFWCPGCQV